MSNMKTILLHNVYDEMNRENVVFHLDSGYNRDDCLLHLSHLREALASRGFSLHTIDQGDVMTCNYLLFFDMPSFISSLGQFYFLQYMKKESFKRKMLLFLWEPPVVNEQNWNAEYHQYFQTIFTWYDDIVDHNKYIKIHYAQPDRRYHGPAFSNKKFCTMINGNRSSTHPLELYSERRRAIRFFETHHPEDFDLYGVAWDSSDFPSYRGTIREKGDVLSKYKYAICYENMIQVNGYITEKIFDCFRAGCVPVYLGAFNITDYVPEGAFIDFRKFNDYEKLYVFLKQITEEQYQAYIEHIDRYLKSSLYTDRFSKEAFGQAVIDRIITLDQTKPI
ncbi:glycosyltransferase family 10 domain-containing protein [Paenibacillus sp. LHD-38]|uniref:glycosyltransferase family 10 domain-containing protein n=1 Tax=Paenibacillus sp. LHD-38 TaxID=3072143 RepID=UPI00280C9D95|nr:glycosyltransferase family 10 [Paenibacillus sp. LHD-38]MDQ8738636.1 glycosyltransferase family 10 [Paenibacillus sp. LHD-38]